MDVASTLLSIMAGDLQRGHREGANIKIERRIEELLARRALPLLVIVVLLVVRMPLTAALA
jgi:hypothetical protein